MSGVRKPENGARPRCPWVAGMTPLMQQQFVNRHEQTRADGLLIRAYHAHVRGGELRALKRIASQHALPRRCRAERFTQRFFRRKARTAQSCQAANSATSLRGSFCVPRQRSSLESPAGEPVCAAPSCALMLCAAALRLWFFVNGIESVTPTSSAMLSAATSFLR